MLALTQSPSVLPLDFVTEIHYTKRFMEEKSTLVNRRGFGLKQEILPMLQESYHSPLIEQIKASHFELTVGELTVCLAQEFGFCYGVDRAVDLAYETRKRFPDRKIYLTSEIIHYPRVNSKLRELGIEFLFAEGESVHRQIRLTDESASGGKGSDSVSTEERKRSLDSIKKEDVVLIPAFGTTAEELEILKSKGAVLV